MTAKNQSIINLFPIERRQLWTNILNAVNGLQEIRLRAGQPILLSAGGVEYYASADGKLLDMGNGAHYGLQHKAQYIRGDEIEEIIQHICNYSVYAFEDELRQGYVTVRGGHRIGVAGQIVLDDKGKIKTIKHIRYLNIRIAHEIPGAADEVMEHIYKDDGIKNTLIISPPGCGKTTILRDIIRQLSDGRKKHRGLNIGVVDERSEIAGSFMGEAQNYLGARCDVMDACPKQLGMMMLLRSMAPNVLAVDELGSDEEFEELRKAMHCGCSFIATIHGESVRDVFMRFMNQNEQKLNLFELFIILGKKENKPHIYNIFGREEAYA